jgi:hypothetical protein
VGVGDFVLFVGVTVHLIYRHVKLEGKRAVIMEKSDRIEAFRVKPRL